MGEKETTVNFERNSNSMYCARIAFCYPNKAAEHEVATVYIMTLVIYDR